MHTLLYLNMNFSLKRAVKHWCRVDKASRQAKARVNTMQLHDQRQVSGFDLCSTQYRTCNIHKVRHGLLVSIKISTAAQMGWNGMRAHWDSVGRGGGFHRSMVFLSLLILLFWLAFVWVSEERIAFQWEHNPPLWSANMRYCNNSGDFFFFSITVQCSVQRC